MSDTMQITLKAARVNRGMTQHDVCEILHITNRTLCNWETGKVKIPGICLYALANLYEISIDNIFLPEKST